MVFVSKKIINGKERYYLERSIRMSDSKIKKYSIYLKDYSPNKKYSLLEYEKALEEKTNRELENFATKRYKTDNILTESAIKKIERIKLGYKKIINKLTKNQFKDVLDRFAVNFTYESNAIEGNSLTLKDVTFVIQEGKVPKGKDLREVYETINTRKALDLIFQKKIKIKEKDIIKLHIVLVKETGVSEGYKKLPNFLLGRNVKTTPPEKVEKEMKELLDWYNKNKKLHPLYLATIFHGKFEKIHPFEDGNGRVGRLLINIILLENGYPPLIIRKTQRVKYFSALEAFDNGHKDKVYRFLLDKYKDTYRKFFEVYIKYLD